MDNNIVEYFKALEKELPEVCRKLDENGFEVVQNYMKEWFIGLTMQMYTAHANGDKE
jgi:hypothetical protein